mgnify:CR=1 FL=1
MGGLEIFYVILAIYIIVLILCTAFSFMEVNGLTPSGWVKVIFWPITVLIFLLGAILWLSIWVPRNLFKGLILCFDEIGDFFINIFFNAIGEKD